MGFDAVAFGVCRCLGSEIGVINRIILENGIYILKLKEQQLLTITEIMIWCHSCQKQTTISQYSCTCALCGSPAIEKSADTQHSPNSFQPYVIGQQQNSQSNQANGQQEEEQDIEIPIQLNIRTVVMESLDRPGQFTVIRVVSSNLPTGQQTRNPVSKQIIEKLEKVDNIGECAVCHEEGGHGLKLKCTHSFHDHCLKPWFEQTNTCPSCRKQVQ